MAGSIARSSFDDLLFPGQDLHPPRDLFVGGVGFSPGWSQPGGISTAMDWEVGQAYSIEAEGPDGEMVYLGEMMTYLGELTMEWTAHQVHVFRTQNGSLLGVRDEDIASWSPSG